ncbi:plasmid mobilization relaxosome protein MobC [Paradesertivirga mongoliensis]|uniref:Plasmid mobilization relaxosome protein MobC n=1 Tax=Paradesertivirga mongoliensis TaxID=2100740 RepID=A0ABW4ZRT7_9SPHI|nr:plasmid mobilization relaxosome protein MobC [Pedobacter mongoliensis]
MKEDKTMPRKKVEENQRLEHKIQTRVTRAKFNQLSELAKKATNGSTSDLLRDILYKREIKVQTVDKTLAEYMPELVKVRKELNAIGNNINQITRYFHQSPEETKKLFYATRVASLYENTGSKVAELLHLIEELGKKWLQK